MIAIDPIEQLLVAIEIVYGHEYASFVRQLVTENSRRLTKSKENLDGDGI